VVVDHDLLSGSDIDHSPDVAVDEMLVVVDAGGGCRLGLPLADVARVLEVPTGALKPVGSWHVLHAEGMVLPVVRALPSLAPAGAGDSTQVVVVRTLDGGEVWIAVTSVEDLAPASASAALAEDGLDGVVVVAGRLAGQLDVRRAVADALAACPLGDAA